MPTDLIFTLVAVFGTVALFIGACTSLVLARTAPERRRLREMAAPRPASPSETLQLTDAPGPTAARFGNLLPASASTRTARQKRLATAGFSGSSAPEWLSAAQVALGFVCAAVPLLLMGISAGFVVAAAGGVIGYLLPDVFIGRRVAARKKAIQDGLPDALDLIVICMEAGSSLDQAILKASTELELALSHVAREFRTVAMETRAGKPRLQCFQDLAARTGVEDVRALVAMLIQTDRFGTSIAQSLRTHADTARTNRRLRAEERAGKVGVKLVFPLVLCLMPALYVVCLGPVAVSLHNSLF